MKHRQQLYGAGELTSLEGLVAKVAAVPNPVILLEGTRDLPEHYHPHLVRIASILARTLPRATFRSGNADGSDAAFAAGVHAVDPARLEIVLPYEGHRRASRPTDARVVALEKIWTVAEGRLLSSTYDATPGYERLTDAYRATGRASVPGSKAAYLLRDTLKVTGVPEAGIAPATLGLFYVNPDDPLRGGTGHTLRVCARHGVPTVLQSVWMKWLERQDQGG